MTNEQTFYALCKAMANMEDLDKTFWDMGLVVEPRIGIGYFIYKTCDILYDVIHELLDFPTIDEENQVTNEIMKARNGNVDEISKRIWRQYGIK